MLRFFDDLFSNLWGCPTATFGTKSLQLWGLKDSNPRDNMLISPSIVLTNIAIWYVEKPFLMVYIARKRWSFVNLPWLVYRSAHISQQKMATSVKPLEKKSGKHRRLRCCFSPCTWRWWCGDDIEEWPLLDQREIFGYPWEGTLAVVPQILTYIVLYKHYIRHAYTGGILWYISWVLSQGYPIFPFD